MKLQILEFVILGIFVTEFSNLKLFKSNRPNSSYNNLIETLNRDLILDFYTIEKVRKVSSTVERSPSVPRRSKKRSFRASLRKYRPRFPLPRSTSKILFNSPPFFTLFLHAHLPPVSPGTSSWLNRAPDVFTAMVLSPQTPWIIYSLMNRRHERPRFSSRFSFFLIFQCIHVESLVLN